MSNSIHFLVGHEQIPYQQHKEKCAGIFFYQIFNELGYPQLGAEYTYSDDGSTGSLTTSVSPTMLPHLSLPLIYNATTVNQDRKDFRLFDATGIYMLQQGWINGPNQTTIFDGGPDQDFIDKIPLIMQQLAYPNVTHSLTDNGENYQAVYNHYQFKCPGRELLMCEAGTPPLVIPSTKPHDGDVHCLTRHWPGGDEASECTSDDHVV